MKVIPVRSSMGLILIPSPWFLFIFSRHNLQGMLYEMFSVIGGGEK